MTIPDDSEFDVRRLPSRALEWAGYHASSRTLRARFRHGGLYDYLDVPPDVFDGLIHEAHPWTVWGAHIKATYDVRRLE